MSEIKVLFVTSEIAPLIKTGGLADVSGALPPALRALNIDVRVLVPGYPQVMKQMGPAEVVATFPDFPGFPASRLIFSIMKSGVPLLVLDCPALYRRDGGPYMDPVTGHDWTDNPIRFGLLSKIASVLGSDESPLSWHPDLVHGNDWQTGLTGVYLSVATGAVPNIITIHNLAFQGNFRPKKVELLNLPPESFNVNGIELYGNMSFLKAGLYYAYHITTVSPNYAREIQGDELGFGLQGLLRSRSSDITGILNGIDTDEWNPETDPYLSDHFSAGRMAGKAQNKQALQSRMGLEVNSDVPLLGVVSRLTHQKGLDLLLEIAPRLLELPVQLVILGSGEASMQKIARDLAQENPGKIAAMIGFDEGLSHQIEAGIDLFVMPSRFEPCGLNQFYSQRYGTPPIVHNTGGLADSVVDCNADTLREGTASGFVFSGMTADNLFATIQRAIEVYRDERKWKALRKNCMTKDFTWETSARAYREVYLKVLGRTV
ncbi:MAG: glycogen synthase GlgA [Proteobacteria bacterium]|nr:glycogen synthase GlgA [Pseudomonadota bacterium]